MKVVNWDGHRWLAEPGRVHGGPSARGAAAHDFSTNSNAVGPCPAALQAVADADATRYPDPAYSALRARLAQWHGVPPERIVVAGSASEFIHRITLHCALRGVRRVALPAHSYGDYQQAAHACGMEALRPREPGSAQAGLHWACEPSSPLGQSDLALASWGPATALRNAAVADVMRVVDCAYAPLVLGAGGWAGAPAPAPAGVWQLWTPNKAMGLTGVRAAYAVAPEGCEAIVAHLHALAPSWPVGAHGVALLHAWAGDEAQRWLRHSHAVLAEWKQRQLALCADLGWAVHAGSLANYFTAHPGMPQLELALEHLRDQGVQLRECTSFGLPGQVRLGVLPPASQDALRRAWQALPPVFFKESA